MSTNETASDHLAWLREFAAWDEEHDDEQRAEALRRLTELAKDLHSATNRAEMACHQEQCNNCPGCSRAEELDGDPMADWKD
jgi:hypothetical protein